MLFFQKDEKKIKEMDLKTFISYIEDYPEHKNKLHEINSYNQNILFFIKDYDKIKFLVEEKKVEINIESESGYTPIFFSNAEVVEYYHKKGLNIHAKSEEDYDVYSTVCLEAAKKLIKLGLKLEGDMISPLFLHHSSFINEETYQKYHLLFEHGYKITEPVSYYTYARHVRLFKDLTEKNYQIPTEEYPNVFLLMLNENKKESLSLFLKNFIRTSVEKENLFKEIVKKIYNYNHPSSFLNGITKYLEINLQNYNIDETPWYFKYKLDKYSMEYLTALKIPVHKIQHEGKNILFYKDDFNEVKAIVGSNHGLMLEKDNDGKSFIEYIKEPRLNNFIDYCYDEHKEGDFHKILKEEILFPSFLEGKLDFSNGFKGMYSKEFYEDVALFEKNKIELSLKNSGLSLKSKSIKRI